MTCFSKNHLKKKSILCWISGKLEKHFPECEVSHYLNTDEWEIIGPNYRKFYDEHMDYIEEECNNHSGHFVYVA